MPNRQERHNLYEEYSTITPAKPTGSRGGSSRSTERALALGYKSYRQLRNARTRERYGLPTYSQLTRLPAVTRQAILQASKGIRYPRNFIKDATRLLRDKGAAFDLQDFIEHYEAAGFDDYDKDDLDILYQDMEQGQFDEYFDYVDEDPRDYEYDKDSPGTDA